MSVETRPVDLRNPFEARQQMFEAIIEGLSSEESLGMDHSAVERRLFGDGP